MIDMIRYRVLYTPDEYMESRSSQMVSELSLAIDMLDKPCPERPPLPVSPNPNPNPNNLVDGDTDNGAHERFLSLNFIFLCFLLKVFV